MLDRHGNPVRIGFAEHELLWIEAANSLVFRERAAAFQDIADLTGRSFAHVQAKAASLRKEAEMERQSATRSILVAAQPRIGSAGPRCPEPGFTYKPPLARLMAGR